MFKLFSKRYLSALLAVVSLSATNSSLMAEYNDSWESYDSSEECCNSSNRFYIGGFGGGLYTDSTRLTQMGTALFPENEGGPLAVEARGRTKSTSTGFGGVQLGYEWLQCPLQIGCSNWSIAPGAEIEAYWFSHKKRGHLISSVDTDRLPEHDFVDTFRMNSGVYLANIVLSLNNSCFKAVSPYVGLGVGATRISLKNARSTQVAPVELGVNHFNSDRNDTSWAFAAQVKAGLRYNICKSFHIFGEYRYLFVDFSNYVFGSTVYPTHAHTTTWNVKMKEIHSNAFVFGVQYDL